jgi:hypothetical protein
VGSKLELHENGSELTGHFDSTENQGGGSFPLHGSIDPDVSQANRALSFSVAWNKDSQPSEFRSVTSYTGQYHKDGEFIDVVFLLANETTPEKSYASVFVGSDSFTKTAPTPEEASRAKKTRRRH